jgi:predicted dinucleotide-binding enzyme
MKICIIGHGNVGSALGSNWTKKGHKILIGARNLESDRLVRILKLNPEFVIMPIDEAVKKARIILVATPAIAIVEIAEQLIHASPKKVIIDATNTLGADMGAYAHGVDAIRQITGLEHVIKGFNSTGFENMANPEYGIQNADMFFAGDSNYAKSKARLLAKDAGFNQSFDFGGDDKIPLLEDFARVWINLAIFQGYGRNIAFKILQR